MVPRHSRGGIPATQLLVTLVKTTESESEKKADVAEHPEVFRHVGLLVNGLPGAAELPFV